jgi:hypothetical protein
MIYRVIRWLGWSVLVSLVPFIGLAIIRSMAVKGWPGFAPLFGAGQLLLTSVAMVAGGIKELSAMPIERRTRRRDALLLSSLIFAVLMAMVYGYLASEILKGKPGSTDPDIIVITSAIFFGISLVTTAGAVAVSDPAEPTNA